MIWPHRSTSRIEKDREEKELLPASLPNGSTYLAHHAVGSIVSVASKLSVSNKKSDSCPASDLICAEVKARKVTTIEFDTEGQSAQTSKNAIVKRELVLTVHIVEPFHQLLVRERSPVLSRNDAPNEFIEGHQKVVQHLLVRAALRHSQTLEVLELRECLCDSKVAIRSMQEAFDVRKAKC